MVTKRALEKYVNEAETIAEEINESPEVVEKVLKQVGIRIVNNRRQPKPPPPEGGISIRGASRKYNIPASTIIGWVEKGDIRVLEHLANWTYISESDLIKKAKKYRPGRGRKKTNKNQRY